MRRNEWSRFRVLPHSLFNAVKLMDALARHESGPEHLGPRSVHIARLEDGIAFELLNDGVAVFNMPLQHRRVAPEKGLKADS